MIMLEKYIFSVVNELLEIIYYIYIEREREREEMKSLWFEEKAYGALFKEKLNTIF